MAKDASGRPIPAYVPDPPNHDGQIPAAQQQFMLAAQKVEEVLYETTDLSVRMGNVEQSLTSDFNAALADFEQRFNTMMLARMQDFQRQVDMAVSAFQRSHPEPQPEPEPESQ